MSQARCPECGGDRVEPTDGGGRRCARCGTKLVKGTRWVPYLLTWAGVGAVVGAGGNQLLERLGLRIDENVKWIAVFLVVSFVAHALSRRFRGLRRA